ncbi:MAG: ATP-binding cassette domain-containing protein, partial [Nitrososphaerota archaeon]
MGFQVGNKALLRVEGVSKRYGSTVALDHVDFELGRGEIHGLLGENGAGKTTLCNIIYGIVKPDAGHIYLDGKRVKFNSPREAMTAGIGMVHQDFTLIPTLTVVDNVVLFTGGNGIFVKREQMAERIEKYAREFGLSINPHAKVSELSAGEKQRLEIIKSLMHGAQILILDEPTSVLTRIETVELFRAMRRMASEGRSVILVTHKIDEVISTADRITVLRQGKRVATIDGYEADRTTLARLIVNRDVVFNLEKTEVKPGEPILCLSDIVCVDQTGLKVLSHVNLEVRRGEIVGVCGVAGNGQKELVEAITGLRQVSSGGIRFLGRDITRLQPDETRWLGIAYVPEEFSMGLVPEFRLHENIVLPPTIAS